MKTSSELLAKNRVYYKENSEEIKSKKAEYRKRNREKINKYAKDRYYKIKDRVRDYDFKKRFGISLYDYNEMLKFQNFSCSICGYSPKEGERRLAVDHDHLTGKIRSLLCRGCNVGIGNLNDNPDLLEKAAEYIRKHKNG